jgi:hypothetical protein
VIYHLGGKTLISTPVTILIFKENTAQSATQPSGTTNAKGENVACQKAAGAFENWNRKTSFET